MNLKRISDMANIPGKLTGLNGTVYISTIEPRHKPRIKFRTSDEDLSFYIENGEISTPKHGAKIPSMEVQKVAKWIALNKQNLLKYWYNSEKYTAAEFILEMKKVQ